MAKSKAPKKGILQTAAQKRAEYQKWLYLLIAGVAVCVVVIFVYMFLVTSGTFQIEGILPWLVALVAAGFLGWFGNKFSKLYRSYTEFLEARKITNDDVKEYLKSR